METRYIRQRKVTDDKLNERVAWALSALADISASVAEESQYDVTEYVRSILREPQLGVAWLWVALIIGSAEQSERRAYKMQARAILKYSRKGQ